MITQPRHFHHLNKLHEQLQKSVDLIEQEESPDIIAQELMMGLMEIHKLLGKEYDDEVLDKVFSEFCIGK